MKLLSALALAALPLTALAGSPEAPTQLAERGTLLLQDDLHQLAPGEWRVAKGKWESVEGVLVGREVPADKHPGVVRHPLKFRDVVIQFDVRLDGARGATLSINSAKEHVCRVLINAAGFSAQKDDRDHEGPDKVESYGRRKLPFQPGEWHTVVAEIVGDTLVATVDGAAPIAGANELIGTEKANLGLTVNGETVAFRNLSVWEAKPKADAAAIRQRLMLAPPPESTATK